MTELLKIVTWNANGLCNHTRELKTFLHPKSKNNVDVMLISETHFTDKSYFKIPNYKVYSTEHPSGKARGGSAVIIREKIIHHELQSYTEEHIQATSVQIEDLVAPFCLTALYSPPKHMITKPMYESFFNSLGNRFIVGGDFNAKHHDWGSRIISPKGRELYRAIEDLNLRHMSGGEPTYWPTDHNKIPDLIDFFVAKNINLRGYKVETLNDLSSDHSPVALTIFSGVMLQRIPPNLHNKKTDWNEFRRNLTNKISPNVSLKSNLELENAVQELTVHIQSAAWEATPPQQPASQNKDFTPGHVKEMIAEKRRLRKRYKATRSPVDKKILNRAIAELKVLLQKIENEQTEEFLSQLSPTQNTDHSLWRATKYLKRPTIHVPPLRNEDNTWARSDEEKANLFARHLVKTFQPWPANNESSSEDMQSQNNNTDQATQDFLEMSIKKFTEHEIAEQIGQMKQKKAPGFDLITAKVLQELPPVGIKLLRNIFNAILRLEYFPMQFKVGKILMFPKPGKPNVEVTSYRPICLLPYLSKVFEKLLLTRIKPIVEDRDLIPNFQFGFRSGCSTTEQVHRVVKHISDDLEGGRYCNAVFLDVRQAFDKVWHEGLITKIQSCLPIKIVNLIRSYLTDRTFFVAQGNEETSLNGIGAGVPQGGVLPPLLYALYSADMPVARGVKIAMYADDTAIMASDSNPRNASKKLQNALNLIEGWLDKWRISVNEAKSVQVTFTLKRDNCPQVKINDKLIPAQDDVKYLGLHLDKRLTWRKHIFAKRCQLGIKLRKMYWLMGRKSKLSMANKVLLYKCMLKPVWTYGIELWGTASNSNVEILQRFQNKTLRQIVNAPWYVPNELIRNDLKIPTVKEEIQIKRRNYAMRLLKHPNELARNLLKGYGSSRLKRMRAPRL